MNLLMISGDRSILQGKRGAFWYTLEEFAKHWDRIDVICPRAKQASCKPVGYQCYRPLGGNVYFHPSPWPLLLQPQWILTRGKELAETSGFAAMTVHEYPPFYNGIGAWLLSRATNAPYVLEIHHVVGYPHAASPFELVGRVLSRMLLTVDSRPATAVRVVNTATAALLASWGVAQKKIGVVPSFYLDREAIAAIGEEPVSADVVCCGRLVPNKRFDVIIDAVASLPGVSLAIIGDGPDRSRLERLVQDRNVANRITFRGWLPDQAAVLRAMKGSNIFVMNSSSEGGPRVLLEAMALGCAVISTRVGIAVDVIRDGVNGVFTTGDRADLSQQIGRLLADRELRHTLGAQASVVLQQFERATLIADYASFIRSFTR